MASLVRDPARGEVARFLGLNDIELDARDVVTRPLRRWLEIEDGEPVGLATLTRRPDDRCFVDIRAGAPSFDELLRAVVRDSGVTHRLHLSLAGSEHGAIDAALDVGFVVDVESVLYDVPFASVLERLPSFEPPDVRLRRADEIDRHRLYRLDNVIRSDVPGSSGWKGHRPWFELEHSGVEFDPAGYAVACRRDGDELVGLCRFWRNGGGPALGLLGVCREHRNGRTALALLRAAAVGASAWGSPTFTTHTARASLQRRLVASGATPTGTFVQLHRPPVALQNVKAHDRRR